VSVKSGEVHWRLNPPFLGDFAVLREIFLSWVCGRKASRGLCRGLGRFSTASPSQVTLITDD